MKLANKSDLESKFDLISTNLAKNSYTNSVNALMRIAQYVTELETTVTLLQQLQPIQNYPTSHHIQCRDCDRKDACLPKKSFLSKLGLKVN